jgi:hypothetical protein
MNGKSPRLILGRCLIRISGGTPGIMIMVLPGFDQSLQATTGILLLQGTIASLQMIVN